MCRQGAFVSVVSGALIRRAHTQCDSIVLAEHNSLIGAHDEDCVLPKAVLLQRVGDVASSFIHGVLCANGDRAGGHTAQKEMMTVLMPMPKIRNTKQELLVCLVLLEGKIHRADPKFAG